MVLIGVPAQKLHFKNEEKKSCRPVGETYVGRVPFTDQFPRAGAAAVRKGGWSLPGGRDGEQLALFYKPWPKMTSRSYGIINERERFN